MQPFPLEAVYDLIVSFGDRFRISDARGRTGDQAQWLK